MFPYTMCDTNIYSVSVVTIALTTMLIKLRTEYFTGRCCADKWVDLVRVTFRLFPSQSVSAIA